VTPKSIRLRKKLLDPNDRKKEERRKLGRRPGQASPARRARASRDPVTRGRRHGRTASGYWIPAAHRAFARLIRR
jgi:hypothetical protein